jgi:mevalonate kinase
MIYFGLVQVILFGEHSVVYGKTAVAACLSRRTTITITNQPGQSIVMDMPEVGLTQFKVDLPQDEKSLQRYLVELD